MIVYARAKLVFLKFRLAENLVFRRDSTEFREQNFVDLLHLGKINIYQLENKTVTLDDAVAFKQPKTKVEDLFRYGRHKNKQVFYLAFYAKDVLPVVRENCLKVVHGK